MLLDSSIFKTYFIFQIAFADWKLVNPRAFPLIRKKIKIPSVKSSFPLHLLSTLISSAYSLIDLLHAVLRFHGNSLYSPPASKTQLLKISNHSLFLFLFFSQSAGQQQDSDCSDLNPFWDCIIPNFLSFGSKPVKVGKEESVWRWSWLTRRDTDVD